MNLKESIKLKGHWILEKFDENGNFIGKSEWDNLFLNSGINEIWKLVCGNGGSAFTNALATIGVGDSNAISGTATGGTATTLVDTSKNWTPNALVGQYVSIVEGTGVGQMRKITANDATSVTVSTWVTIPDNTSKYVIEDPTQTDLQAVTNKTYKAMDTGYPTSGTDQKATFKATFGSEDANYSWQEFVIKNSTSLICLNRKVSNQGTKVSGQTWTLTVELSLS